MIPIYGDAFAKNADTDTIAHEIGCLILELERITSTMKWMRELQIARAEQVPAKHLRH